MAKKIIILEVLKPATGKTVNAVFWYAVPVNRAVPLADAVSAFGGASGDETAALRDGTVVEEPFSQSFAATASQASIKTALETAYATQLAAFNGRHNPRQLFGMSWDGTAWT